jgi:linoleate 10R-lipoxygenase
VPALSILAVVAHEQQVATLKDVSLHLTTNTNDQSGDFLHKLHAAAPNQTPAESTMGIIAEVVASAPLWSAALAHVVEFYLGKGAEMKPAVVELCAENSPDADKALLEYIYEALRTCCCWYGFCGRS